jgi:hypothetical protein
MELKHSGLGITAFIMSLVMGLITFIVVIIAGVLETSSPGGMDENAVAAMVVGFLIIGCILVQLVALGLGIAGLIQKNRKKIFAVLETVFSGMTILGVVFLMLIGTMM